MLRLRLAAFVLGVLGLAAARSEGVPIPATMTEWGQEELTTLYCADLSHAEGTFESVTITDQDLRGGSSGVLSGFDVDFLFFDRDGDLATTGDRILPLADERTYMNRLGVQRKGDQSVYQPTDDHPGPLFGLHEDGSICFGTASLGVRDATYVPGPANLTVDSCDGFLSLGDGGEIHVAFPLFYVEKDDPLFLFLGEVGQPDEMSDTLSEVEVIVGEPIELLVGDDSNSPSCMLEPGESIMLNGSAAGDGDPVVSWWWDLDGDGEYDDGTGEILAVSFEQLVEFGLPINELSRVFLQAHMQTGGTSTSSGDITLVPEPTVMALLAIGGPLLLRRRSRARRSR